jgi:hypothetical protein
MNISNWFFILRYFLTKINKIFERIAVLFQENLTICSKKYPKLNLFRNVRGAS